MKRNTESGAVVDFRQTDASLFGHWSGQLLCERLN